MGKVHHRVCYVLWCLWGIGMALAVISRVAFGNENTAFFFGVLDPYCRVVMLGSMIPVQPVVCLVAMLLAKEEGGSVWRELGYLLLSAALLLTYICVFVWATGGV